MKEKDNDNKVGRQWQTREGNEEWKVESWKREDHIRKENGEK